MPHFAHCLLPVPIVLLCRSPVVGTGGESRRDRNGDPLPEGAIARLGSIGLALAGPAVTLVVSPDGKFVAAGVADGAADVFVVGIATGRKPYRITGRPGAGPALAYTPDGKRLAGLRQKVITAADAATGQVLRRLFTDCRWLSCLAFSPDGQTLAVGEAAGATPTVRRWEVDTGKQLAPLGQFQSAVCSLRFSSDGKQLATYT